MPERYRVDAISRVHEPRVEETGGFPAHGTGPEPPPPRGAPPPAGPESHTRGGMEGGEPPDYPEQLRRRLVGQALTAADLAALGCRQDGDRWVCQFMGEVYVLTVTPVAD